MFREYFRYQDPGSMLGDLNNTRKTERDNIQVTSINSTLTDFKIEIGSMSENEIESEQPNE